jgi:hypothetical protein
MSTIADQIVDIIWVFVRFVSLDGDDLQVLNTNPRKGTADGVAVPSVTELGNGDQLGSPAGWARRHHDATFRQMKFTENIATKKAKTTAPSTELRR